MGVQSPSTLPTHALSLSVSFPVINCQQVLLPSTTTVLYDQHSEGATHR